MPKTTSLFAVPAMGPVVSTPVLAIPETGFLRQSQVLKFVPISKSTLWRRVKVRTFPAPVKLSERITVWRVEDIRQWIAEQAVRA